MFLPKNKEDLFRYFRPIPNQTCNCIGCCFTESSQSSECNLYLYGKDIYQTSSCRDATQEYLNTQPVICGWEQLPIILLLEAIKNDEK
jgi:hypothetical protein